MGKRGRKAIEPEQYEQDSKIKIEKQRKDLQKNKNNMESKERQRARNKMSALKSRVDKKNKLRDLKK